MNTPMTATAPSMTTRDTVYIALFAAIIVAFGFMPRFDLAPGVPFSLQAMGIMLAGAVLGARRGMLAVLLFLLLVALGLPVLTGGTGGLSKFAGATGGFLVSWPIAAYLIGLLVERFWARLTVPLALTIIFLTSLVVMYVPGTIWWSIAANTPYPTVLKQALAFIPGDFLKAVLAAVVAVTVKRANLIIRPAPVAATR